MRRRGLVWAALAPLLMAPLLMAPLLMAPLLMAPRLMALLGMALVGGVDPANADDRSPAPPALEVVTSPDGAYSLAIEVARPAGAPLGTAWATGTLRRGGAVVWRRELDPPVRPRFAVVDNAGRVALFGRWENTPADMTVEVLAPDGAVVAALGRAEIEAAVGLPAARIVAGARLGAWLDRAPAVADGGVALGAAGRALVLNLRDGTLRAAQP